MINRENSSSRLKNIRYNLHLFFFYLFVFSNLAFAQRQWTENGMSIGPSTANPVNQAVISDDNGGVFVVFEHNPTSDSDIYAQWVDGSGAIRWGSSGVAISTSVGNQKNPVAVSDGAGGMFIAWHDEGTGKISVQRINFNKTLLWASAKSVSTAGGTQTSPQLVSDNVGGLIVVWKDERNKVTTGIDLYAQRLDANGSKLWINAGMLVCEATDDQTNHIVIPDGAGGAYVVWEDYRSHTANGKDIYAQRISQQTGARLWQVGGSYEGFVVSSASTDQQSISATISGSNLAVTWTDSRNGNTDVYAQLMDANGNVLWTADGVPVTTKPGSQTKCKLAPDGNGGAIIAWSDFTLYNIWAQRLNSSGTRQWSDEGMTVSTNTLYQINPEIVSDDSGGVFIFWSFIESGDYNIYGQHVRGDMTKLWEVSGKVVSNATGSQTNHKTLSDGSGGAIIVWQDGRSGDSDLYGQRFNENLTVTDPQQGALLAGNQSQSVRWKMRTTDTFYSYLVLKISTNPGDGFPTEIAGSVNPAGLVYNWTPSTVNSSTTQVRIEAYNDEDVQLFQADGPVFSVDSSPPNAFSLSSPADGSTVSLTPTFSWQATTDNLSGLDFYELWIDGVLFKNNLSATSYTLTEGEKLTEASHTWQVKAVDNAGLIRQSAVRNLTATQDGNPPNAFNLVSPANNTWTSDITPALTWQATTDVETGIKKYQLFVDGNLHQDNINPAVTSVSTANLSNGSHNWYINAVDSSDNVRKSTQTWTVKIDNTAPAVFDVSAPANDTWTADTTPSFSWESATDAGIGLDHFALFVDGSSVADPVTGTSYTLTAGSALTEGTHNWTVKAYDALDNERSATSTFTLRIDETQPTVFSPSTPRLREFVTAAIPHFTWQASSDAGSGLSHYELWIDGSLNQDNLPGNTANASGPLPEGGHYWLVKAEDNAGNVRTSATYNFFIDTQAPESFVLNTPAQGETIHTNKPTFDWDSTTDATSGFLKFQLLIDDQLVADNLGVQETSYTQTSAMNNGTHTWAVKAYDNAGNVRTAATITFTVSIGPPVFTSATTVQATEDLLFTYTATATDPDGDNLTYSFSGYPGWLSPGGNQLSGTPTEGTANTSFTASVTDGLFTTTQTVNITVQAVNDPPEITSLSSVSATEHQAFTYTATASDPENDAVTFTFSSYPDWLSPSGSRISGTPSEGAGNTSFQVTASDGSLTDQLTVTVTLTTVNDAPNVTSATSVQATEHQLFTYTATASDPENNPLTYTFDDYPDWMTPSGNQISGTPPESASNTSFKVTASDGSLSDTETVTVTVTPVNDAPQITSPLNVTATEHQVFTYSATATDPENDALTFTFSSYPGWLTPSGNQISGTPPEGSGDASFEVRVSDGSLSDQESVTISLQLINDAPTLTSPTAASATEHQPFSYTATATDPENNAITFVYDQKPAWLNATGAVLNGTPPEGAGDTSFRVTASDGSLSDQQTVTLSITPVNDAPQITSATNASATEHVFFSYTTSATDPEGDVLTFAFNNMPAWLSAAGATISGTPPEGAQDTSFTAIVTDGELNDMMGVNIDVTSVNDAPQITSSLTVSATEHEVFSYTATGSDPENNPLTFSFSDYPVWLAPNGASIGGTPPEGAANMTFKVTVSDGSLSDQETVSVTVTPVNDAPQITSPPTADAVEHQLFNYTATAWDPESDPLTFTFTEQPAWLTANGAKLSGTPPEGAVDFNFQIQASDGQLSDQETVAVTLLTVNDAPRITSSATATATEHVSFSYTATATDPENNPVSFTFSDFPSWLQASEEKISGTPSEGSGNTSFKITASDGSLTDNLTVQLTVTMVNDAPEITSPLTAEATEHENFSYTATGSDPENDALTFTFSDHPVWLSGQGAIISGRPPESAQSTSFKVTASDGSLSDVRTVTLTVTPVNDVPQLTSPTTAAAKEDQDFTYSASATDPEDNPLTFSFEQTPAWLSPRNGHRLAGKPVEGNGDTSFVVVVTDGDLFARQTVQITVEAVNDPPVVTSPDTASAREDTPFAYTAAGSDIEGAEVTFSFRQYPAWLRVEKNVILGTPTEGIPDTSFQVIVSDGSLTDTLKVNLKVQAVNDAPVIVSSDSVQAT